MTRVPACKRTTRIPISRATLPADGSLLSVALATRSSRAGPDYAYRLRLSEPRPDFALRAVPSGLNVRAGMSVPADRLCPAQGRIHQRDRLGVERRARRDCR